MLICSLECQEASTLGSLRALWNWCQSAMLGLVPTPLASHPGQLVLNSQSDVTFYFLELLGSLLFAARQLLYLPM